MLKEAPIVAENAVHELTRFLLVYESTFGSKLISLKNNQTKMSCTSFISL
jgi:hypothetical protein